MKNLSIRLLLYCSVAMIPVSCGIRKVQNDSESVKILDKDSSKSEGSVTKEDWSLAAQQEYLKYKRLTELYSSKVTELFDENGKLKERISEYQNKKEDESSSENRSFIVVKKMRVDSIFKNVTTRYVTITKEVKSKNTDTNKTIIGNIGVSGMITSIVVFGLLLFLLFRKPIKA